MKIINHGFHLFEILIVLVIIGLLAAISIPTYSEYFAHAKRLEAESLLAKLAIAMEHYYIEHNSYRAATLETLHISDQSIKNHYRLAIQTENDNVYLLTAVPLSQQAERDSACGTLTLNSLGEKNISGTDSVNACW